MFRRRSNGEDGVTGDIAAIIDWQESHPGTLTEDLCRMLVNSTAVQFRRQNAVIILESYHKELRDLLGKTLYPEITLEVLKELFLRQLKYSAGCYSMESCLLLTSPDYEGKGNEARMIEMLGRLKGAIEDI